MWDLHSSATSLTNRQIFALKEPASEVHTPEENSDETVVKSEGSDAGPTQSLASIEEREIKSSVIQNPANIRSPRIRSRERVPVKKERNRIQRHSATPIYDHQISIDRRQQIPEMSEL